MGRGSWACFTVLAIVAVLLGPKMALASPDATDTILGSGGTGGAISTGHFNTLIGNDAGPDISTGGFNTMLGYGTGWNNNGTANTFLGDHAGYSTTGSWNVFIGNGAGWGASGSNRLYIDNCYGGFLTCLTPLIYGEFDNRLLKLDGTLEIVTVVTPSDRRYKKEIQPLGSALEKIMQLQGVSYAWNKDKARGAGFKDGRQIGLIAQDVEKVLPELVQTDSKGYKTLSYDKLTPVLIEAMKEQENQIREKDARIERLEKALERMERRLASIEGLEKTVAAK